MPATIDGLPVTSVGDWVFFDCANVTDITIPNSVTNIGDASFFGCSSLTSIVIPGSVISVGSYAFSYCTGLKGVYFRGDAPSVGLVLNGVFNGDYNLAAVYYLPGTTGWNSSFAGVPTVLWNSPQARIIRAPGFGARTNRFGFNIIGTTNITIAVEACADLTSANWTLLQTCALTNGSLYFNDSQWTNYPARFYRIRFQ